MVDLGVRIEEVIKAMFEKSSSIIKGKREELGNQSSQEAASVVQARDHIWLFQNWKEESTRCLTDEEKG